jgi:hypothetical protein
MHACFVIPAHKFPHLVENPDIRAACVVAEIAIKTYIADVLVGLLRLSRLQVEVVAMLL